MTDLSKEALAELERKLRATSYKRLSDLQSGVEDDPLPHQAADTIAALRAKLEEAGRDAKAERRAAFRQAAAWLDNFVDRIVDGRKRLPAPERYAADMIRERAAEIFAMRDTMSDEIDAALSASTKGEG